MLSSPVIAHLAQLARIDASRPIEHDVMNAAVLGHCLSSFIDGDDPHCLPRADAGKFTEEHAKRMAWRWLLSGCEGARYAAWNNARLAASGAFDKPSAQ